MTVRELIEDLARFPGDREVYVCTNDGELLLMSVENARYQGGYGPLVVKLEGEK